MSAQSFKVGAAFVGGLALVAMIWAHLGPGHLHAENVMKVGNRVRAGLTALGVSLGAGHVSAGPVQPTVIGVNLSQPSYFRSRAFANLAMGSAWGASDHSAMGDDQIDGNGNVLRMSPGVTLGRMLSAPSADSNVQGVRCTWTGTGDLRPVSGAAQNVGMGRNSFTFLPRRAGETGFAAVPLKLSGFDASSPLRDLDCRETGMPVGARFDPRYLDSLRGFKVIRFMDWQRTNNNERVTWATRHTPKSIDIIRDDGVSIEDMIAVSKEIGADPWFCMPWNADDDYVLRFARMVHDQLPDRTVYVELSNEVWNQSFPVSKQAMQEGQQAHLSENLAQAGLMRYAQRLSQVLDIWAKVYSDRPNRLVRVASCQNGAACLKTVLGFKDTARHVDAAATAPYFGGAINKAKPTTADETFQMMDAEIDRVIALAVAAKDVATQHQKRYLAYEGGQHLLFRDMDLQKQVQRDPRMHDAYAKYLSEWRTKLGDTLTLFNSTSPIGRFGAWGLAEYIGQPLSEAPKLRAVAEVVPLGDRSRK